jgi:hypothetical protein
MAVCGKPRRSIGVANIGAKGCLALRELSLIGRFRGAVEVNDPSVIAAAKPALFIGVTGRLPGGGLAPGARWNAASSRRGVLMAACSCTSGVTAQ